MMHRPLLLVVLIGIASALGFCTETRGEKVKRVLFIGIDGCRFDAMTKARTPNLDRLMDEGCYDSDCQILGERYQGNDTISGPGWSSILTGVWADKHGVQNNFFQGKNYDEFPHFFARLKEGIPDAYTVSVVTWAPIQIHIVSAADEGIQFIPVKKDYAGADVKAADAVIKVLSEQDPTALFYYIGQVDETGHKHGFHPTVPEYITAIEQADRHIGDVLETLEERENFDDEEWLIVVTSDHGGRGTGHSQGHQEPEILNSFIIVSGDAAQRGHLEQETFLVDAPATVLKFLGVDLESEWEFDGQPVGLK